MIIENKKIQMVCKLCIGLNLLLLLIIGLFVRLHNEYVIEFDADDGAQFTIEFGEDIEMMEVGAKYKGNILLSEGIDVDVVQQGNVDTSKLGSYDVSYTAMYEDVEKSITVKYIVEDNKAPVIDLVVNEDSYTSPKDNYAEEGYTALDNCDGDITDQVIREEKDGKVIYTVEDSSGNIAVVERVIVYKDKVAPVITLNGDNEIKVNIGDIYTEEGYVAVDDCDGDITERVAVEGTVDTATPGNYLIEYKVKDSYGNVATVSRNISVADFKAPVISLNGEKKLYIKVGSEYAEAGFKAQDNVDGDVTDKVVVSGKVDTSKCGSYKIQYTVTDKAGNTVTENREVYVFNKQANTNTVNPGNKVVYLTFDDGPGPYTKKLLDILDKYGVKATFFVAGQKPAYHYMIGETYRRGHTIALHTYSHQYSIYSSEDTYYADLKKIEDVCVEQTGVKPTIVRFPGGTSNTISRNYCKGIMTALTKSLSYHGYLYCDWNVSSGDAGGAKTKEEVANNVINGIKRNNVSIVLQHDISSFSVDAVETIITWGLANGYTFLPMDENAPMVHHPANN